MAWCSGHAVGTRMGNFCGNCHYNSQTNSRGNSLDESRGNSLGNSQQLPQQLPSVTPSIWELKRESQWELPKGVTNESDLKSQVIHDLIGDSFVHFQGFNGNRFFIPNLFLCFVIMASNFTKFLS